ncbi:MAG: hypothetical protein K2H01_04165 [Ruminococcus sp.]|nr:hypothetical protein [Ruminococcus sp.]
MKKAGFIVVYIVLPIAAAVGVKIFLDRRKCRTMSEPIGICLKPVKWKLSLEK